MTDAAHSPDPDEPARSTDPLGPLARRVRRSLNGDHPGETGVMLPPFIDHHVHLQLADPAPAVARGIAAVVDLGADPGAIATIARADGLPHVRYAGAFLTARGGYPTGRPWAPAGSVRELDAVSGDADDLRERRHHALSGPVEAAVDEQRRFGASVVKVALNSVAGPAFDRPTLDAVVAAARAAGLPVAVHAEGAGMAELAIDAGADVLVHAPFTERLEDDVIARAVASRQAWISTLAIHVRDDASVAETAIDNVRRFHAAGGRVLYGTDSGNGELEPGVNPVEVAALVRAGLAASAIIAALADPWPEPTPGWADAGVATFVPDPAPADGDLVDPDAVARWLATARLVPTEELELR
ncbi:amidohydrolase family protein [Agromyces kandeliae]|uniref:Amidohydrolase family protein n=1 Tax=Agromyces kandeliae TaxID=2666141 RepID=A0A6L5QZH7_9MICO|nr:amidohydrolase family protein [Agromyces kandeliae]MRX43035.1 amidohydrolase family protein [Agromyces kandeliae]